MHQRLSLIPVSFVRIIIVSAEVAALKYLPINPAQIGKIIGIVGIVRTGMLVGYQERNPLLAQVRKRSNENDNLTVVPLSHSAARMNIKRHHRAGRKIERYVVAQRAAWLSWHYPSIPLVDHIGHADVDEIRISATRITAMQPVAQNPRQVAFMGDAEDQRVFRCKHGQRQVDSLPKNQNREALRITTHVRASAGQEPQNAT
jgi:hypothetical protein